MGLDHEVAPQPRRQAAAGDALHRRCVIVAQPHAGDEIGAVADEPGIPEPFAGAGLAGGGTADLRRPSGAVLDHRLEHPVHVLERPGPDGAAGAGARAPVKHLAGPIAHLRNREGPEGIAVIGEGAEGRRQLQQRHLRGAERKSRLALEPRRDAEPSCRSHHRLDAGMALDPDRHRVDRVGQRLGQAYLAAVAFIVVLGAPALDRHRRVQEHTLRVQPRLEAGEIDQGLEGGTRLTQRLGRPVELARRVIAPADHGPDRAVGRHRHQRRLPGAEPGAGPLQRRRHLGLGDPLQAPIQGGGDDEIAVPAADIALDLGEGPVGEVTPDAPFPGAQARRGAYGLRCLGFGDVAERRHAVEHEAGALRRAVPVPGRGVARRGLQQPRQHRRLVEGQLLGRLAEIAPRRRRDAEGAGAEIDAVEVDRQDLVLGELALEPERQHHLLDLALQCPFGPEEQVLGKLLGDGRAALDDSPGLEVGDRGAKERGDVDAEVIVKTLVLDRHHGAGHVARQIGNHDGAPVDLAEGRKRLSVAGQKGDGGTARERGDAFDLGQIVGVPGEHGAGEYA